MNLAETEKLARQLMQQHGLSNVAFRWTNAKRQFGAAVHKKRNGVIIYREMRLSAPMVRLNDFDEVNDTILHEIAHLLAGPEAGHGPLWRRIARQIGAKPNRLAGANVAAPQAKYVIVCENCGVKVGERHKRRANLSRYTHKPCGKNSQLVYKLNRAA